MFSTKRDVMAWIKDYGNGYQFTPIKDGKYWYVSDAEGFKLTEERIAEIEYHRA